MGVGSREFTVSFIETLHSFFPSRSLGRRAEAVAARYLRRQGLQLIARNYSTRGGEIDIILLLRSTLVFVEVKSRTLARTRLTASRCEENEGPDPLAKIHPEKVERIRRAARSYLRRARGHYEGSRIDGVVVEFERAFGGRRIPVSLRWYPGLNEV